jgi:hypothetical protein
MPFADVDLTSQIALFIEEKVYRLEKSKESSNFFFEKAKWPKLSIILTKSRLLAKSASTQI